MRRIIALVTVSAMMTLVASPLQAQEPLPLHAHQLLTPGASDPVLAQGICSQELLDPALAEVHENFHLGEPVTEAFEVEPNPVGESVASCP